MSKQQQLTNIRNNGGRVYVRIRAKKLTMTLRYGIMTITVSDEYSARKVGEVLQMFNSFILVYSN